MNQDLLDEIEYYASLLLTVNEIAIQLDLDEYDFKQSVQTPNTPERTAFYKGRLKTTIQHRKSVLEFAEKGSPQAEHLLEGYLQKQKKSEL